MLGAALQSAHIKDRLPERLAAKTAAPRRRVAGCRLSGFGVSVQEADGMDCLWIAEARHWRGDIPNI